jgi:hypothetical protein
MPLLDPVAAAIVIALVTIAYGLRWEKYYTAWISVVMNVVFTVVTVSSTDFPIEIAYILIAYIVVGAMAAWQNWRSLFFLFGTKTFGALMLTVALA